MQVYCLYHTTGETCLPGGMREERDASLVDTALREAEEEVGLPSRLTELVAVLPPFLWDGVIRLAAVTVVVCWLRESPSNLQLQPNSEVESFFWVPLRFFMSNTNLECLRTVWRDMPIHHRIFTFTCPRGVKYHIWGLTSTICITVASMALDQRPAFPMSSFLIHSSDAGSISLAEVACMSNQLQLYRGSQLAAKL